MKMLSKVFTGLLLFSIAIIACKDDTVAPFVGGPRTASISIAAGSSQPGCEQTSRCYLPFQAVVGRGGEVTWSNDDSAVHTVTSGTPQAPTSVFNSSLMSPGQTFTVTVTDTGTIGYPPHCQVHPWIIGQDSG